MAQKQPGAKPLKAMPGKGDNGRERSTACVSEDGVTRIATTHDVCGGKGCAVCNDLGFTYTGRLKQDDMFTV